MFDVARFWLNRGASGLRLDATPYLFEDPSFPDDPDPKSGPPIGLKPYNSARPENHGVLQELRAVLNGYQGDRVLLGESVTATMQDLNAVYGSNRDEIQLPMDFFYGDLKTLNASGFKKQVDAAETELKSQTPVLFLSSHDHPRQWSVFGDGKHNDQIAKLTAAATLLPRGTALMYYGEEIGMATMPPSQLQTFPTGPKRPRADDRDGERTPMQWTPDKRGGFTTGSPWLPVESDVDTHNVESEKSNADSVLTWYRNLLQLRHTPVFRDGAYIPLDSGNASVFAFARSTSDRHSTLVVLNMSGKEQNVSIKGMPGKQYRIDKILMASPLTDTPADLNFLVAPYAAVIANATASF
jgi:alpha-glucosidase